ncbi:hypothetical protein BBK14_33155 [Parafrankia soli]|uniref:Uncharacterized protein n=1 Tax=Parafrankia soli TaxID=2599596 RepID=A0A1S1QXT7_9ACTN|nr:hypothetical protein [Parafrankia soli]OHV38291.1 hypothetical protein BBK14_33155 [Parafrankia soli]
MTAYVCPECGESATDDAHLDGSPLCPVVGAAGYEPARAVLVDSPEGQLVQDQLLDAFGVDAALDVIRNGTSEQDALDGVLGSAGSYGLDLDGIAPAVGASFREHLTSYRGRTAH